MTLQTWWIRDKHELMQGPTFANIAAPDEAIAVIKREELVARLEDMLGISHLDMPFEICRLLDELRERTD